MNNQFHCTVEAIEQSRRQGRDAIGPAQAKRRFEVVKSFVQGGVRSLQNSQSRGFTQHDPRKADAEATRIAGKPKLRPGMPRVRRS